MEFFRKISYIIVVALSSMLLLAAVGCKENIEPEEIQENPETKVYLSLTMVTNTSLSSRADIENDDDFEEIGSAAENYIDFENGDFRVALFDNKGEYLMELKASDDWTKYPMSNVNDRLYYRLEIEFNFPKENLDASQIDEIIKNGMYVMVLANCRAINRNANFDYDSENNRFGAYGKSTKVSELWKNGTAYNFTYALRENGTWTPDLTDTQTKLIPMFGYVLTPKFETPRADGKYETNVVIPMQRALAKIEVIDNLTDKGFEIDDVRMTDYNSTGRVIPDLLANPDWDQIGKQVTSSSLPDNPNNIKTGLKFLHDAPNKKWIAYVPEMKLDGTPDASGNRTHLNVDVQQIGSSATKETYPIHFAKYNESFKPTIPNDSWNHILRNHIYRFYVNNVGFNVDLHLHVLPWMLDNDEEWNFTDQVTVQQTLEWSKDSYSSYNEETGEVVLKLETNEILEGSFIISSPINGRYYARITPLEGAKPGAISFVDPEGNILEPSSGSPAHCHEVTGVIEEERPYRIYIMATDLGADEQSSFRLDFYVENLGTWINVPMSKDDKFQYFTIIRPGTQLQ